VSVKGDILVVDDSRDMLEVIGRQLGSRGYNTFKATNVIDAIDLLKLSIPKLLITDIQMPGVDGGRLVKYAQHHFPNLPILVITGYPSLDVTIEVLKDGTIDYLTKPFTQSELAEAVSKLLITEKQNLDIETTPLTEVSGFVGKAKSLANTYHLIDKTKNNKVTVLVSGESGTGKELVARAIHYEGKFRDKPFITVNCGAIPENLLESELFGYEKGAFTGATSGRDGFFLSANNGTLFLDEIGNAPSNVQQSLLRVIQEKEIVPVGGRNPKKIDVRIIAATNSNLREMVESGQFREDLYYRLNVVNITMPPLRERKTDIPSLVQHFITKHSQELGKEKVKVSKEVLALLRNFQWPGNIRELENIIHQSLVICDQEIQVNHIPDYLHSSPQPISSEPGSDLLPLKEIELKHIKYVLQHCGNNKTMAAEILGITRKTLAKKLQ